jgi:alkanesulfonate monooxygenase SsuD/methylene tetrahydromethanopterin reductase-like flavin-dependent oxidoreductase (luciferase family)
MRIGLTGGGTSVDKVVEQAKQAEADGFTSLWYASLVTGDPLVAIAIAGRETSTIELGPRLLRVAGELADGTVLWMAPPRAIESHIAPQVHAAASAAHRPAPRIIAGLPVAVHDDQAEARSAAAASSAMYAGMANYQRILDIGGATSPADAAIVGDERSVRAQLQGLLDAGATDIWAAVFPVGDDKARSRGRTIELLKELVS